MNRRRGFLHIFPGGFGSRDTVKKSVWIVFALFIIAAFRGETSAIENVRLLCSPGALSLFQGERIDLNLEIHNGSSDLIDPELSFFFSYHLYNERRQLISFDNRRFAIPRRLLPGEKSVQKIPVFFDKPPGYYWIEWDIVREGKFWGSQHGWKTVWQSLTLKPRISPEFQERYLASRYESGIPWLDDEQYLLRLTLKNCEQKGNDGTLFFSAGSTYPQVWIRDTATFISYARFFYPWLPLARIVERFLYSQKDTGEIVDWIDAAGHTGKNTVETDQESSMVLAACEIALGRPDWLKSLINGKTVWRRLESALEWVWENRRDKKSGLVTSGFTADWGDVEKSYPDQRAIRLSDRSQPVIGIYTQAKFIQAMEKLLEIAIHLGEKSSAARWRSRIVFFKKQVKAVLYLPEEGYFLIHRALTSNAFLETEKKILALGGNAEAITAGLMNFSEIARFLQVLEARRRQYNLRSVSFTLIPPYPRGFFPHPLLHEPWSYQNGGEWDWIGGRLIQALFRKGFRREAETYLREISEKHRRADAIFEWEDRQGSGRGAVFYAGAAGVIGDAILRGFWGILEDFESIRIGYPSQNCSLRIDRDGENFILRKADGVQLRILKTNKKICLIRDGEKPLFCRETPGESRFPNQ